MSSYNRGRKIKHPKHIYRRRKKSSALTVILIIAIIAAVLFVAFSVGRPVIDFFKGLGEESSVTEWTPEIITESVTETSETESPVIPVETQMNDIFVLPEDSLVSAEALTNQIENAKAQGFTSVAVVMKKSGGNLLFRPLNTNAIFTSAEGTLTAEEIADMIRTSGLTPYAVVNVLKDNTAPLYDLSTNYYFADGMTTWLDNKASNGGKPWINPFADSTKTYLADLSRELVASGFSDVVLEDVVFPPFRNSDLTYIGASVQDENRYKALVDIVNVMKNEISTVTGKTYLSLSASDVLSDSCEVYKPAELEGVKYIVTFDVGIFENDITEDKIKEMIAKVKALVPEFVPCINSSEFTAEQVQTIKTVFEESGIKEICIK